VLQGAFLHPHFKILEVKNKPDWTQATTLRLKNQESRRHEIKQQFDTF
jgi:hypothetical protein